MARTVARERVAVVQVAAFCGVASLCREELLDRGEAGWLDDIVERESERAFERAVSLPEGNLRQNRR